jgi:hypothetical protein
MGDVRSGLCLLMAHLLKSWSLRQTRGSSSSRYAGCSRLGRGHQNAKSHD